MQEVLDHVVAVCSAGRFHLIHHLNRNNEVMRAWLQAPVVCLLALLHEVWELSYKPILVRSLFFACLLSLIAPQGIELQDQRAACLCSKAKVDVGIEVTDHQDLCVHLS